MKYNINFNSSLENLVDMNKMLNYVNSRSEEVF